MTIAILGISAFYHDSAAAILVDGQIVAAAQEERFSRIKHDSGFPAHAINYVLNEAAIPFANLSAIVFYEKPFLKFERLLETYHAFAPKGVQSFVKAIPVWMKDKLFMKRMLQKKLAQFGPVPCRISFSEHHLSHAASAFYPSPFAKAAILTVDGVGEWATTVIGTGDENKITIHKELHFPHSLGLLYSAFTCYLGFQVNSGEYKLMGLAPYGIKNSSQTRIYREKIISELVDLKEDGSILLNMRYFSFATGLKMTDDTKWERLFNLPPRQTESKITQDHANLALAIQDVTGEIILRMAKHAKEITGCSYLVMAGGVALNCVANGLLLQSGLFDDIWIQPASGDAGGALGAALAGWHIGLGKARSIELPDKMNGSLLGPEFAARDIQKAFRKYGAKSIHFNDMEKLVDEAALHLADGKIVGWFQGRMEYGPRALGNRSILADARNPEMQRKLNLGIKYREGFRPFAPAVMEENAQEYFDLDKPSPYMLFVTPVNPGRCVSQPSAGSSDPILSRLYQQRSAIPAVTHVDYSARIQTVSQLTNARFYQLLKSFTNHTGCPVLVNTSFNVRGEPIVCTPEDAYRCFMSTEMDVLVIGNFLLKKADQPLLPDVKKGAKAMD
jgi:carbamoyltransferase